MRRWTNRVGRGGEGSKQANALAGENVEKEAISGFRELPFLLDCNAVTSEVCVGVVRGTCGAVIGWGGVWIPVGQDESSRVQRCMHGQLSKHSQLTAWSVHTLMHAGQG